MVTSTNTSTAVVSSSNLAKSLVREKKIKGGAFTLRSIATGVEYTYKISRSEYNGRWYTHISVETQYMKFVRVGTYSNGRIYHKREQVTTPTATAIAFVLNTVEQGRTEWLDSVMEVRHTGKCILCGKTLTDSESIERGMGPECAKR